MFSGQDGRLVSQHYWDAGWFWVTVGSGVMVNGLEFIGLNWAGKVGV